MRVGVIQSNYIPWRGYFDFIDSVDLFVFHDDLQYTKNDWRNRNQILAPEGLRWLTVPVHYRSVDLKIDEVGIDYSRPWAARHIHQLEACYGQAPFFDQYAEAFSAIVDQHFSSISELNVALCRWVMRTLDIHTPTLMSRELNLSGCKTERLVQLLRQVGGDVYLSGPSASNYLDLELFRREGIVVEYKSYDYTPYSQRRQGFQGAVSVLDLLFHKGPDARLFLKSGSPDIIACARNMHAHVA